VTITNFTMRGGTRSVRAGAIAGVALAAMGLSACGSATTRESQAASYLIILNLEAKGTGDEFDHVLASDVLTNGGVIEDDGRVRMTAAMRDVTNPNGPSTNNAITVNRYRVSYRRSDGRNTPGVDVPYPFDGAATFTVIPGEDVSVPFNLVRVQAKEEAPLRALAGNGGAMVISTLADVTFYGRDQVGREVSVTGTIGVNFADWADPETEN
jgi:hypothetical protein